MPRLSRPSLGAVRSCAQRATHGLAALVLSIAIWTYSAGIAHALDLAVDTFGDSAAPSFQACTAAGSDCTLRGAIIKANGMPGPHTITLPSGSYTISIQGRNEDAAQTGDLDILQAISIGGVSPAATVITWDEAIDQANRDRIFDVRPAGNLTIRDLSLRQGAVPNDADAGAFSNFGGSILARGPLTVERTSIRINRAGGGAGLAILGTATVRDSTINNNTAADAGGIYVVRAPGSPTIPDVSIVNTTISTNQATVAGGLHVDASANGVVTLNNATVANNTAASYGGLWQSSGALIARNTIVAINTAASNPNCAGTIGSQGYNLVWGGDTCGMSASNNDIVNTGDPVLAVLADYGGPTATHTLRAGSAAIDKGNPAVPGSGGNACAPADQRGLARAIDGDADGITRCDIGAAEGGRWMVVDTSDDNAALQACDTNPSNGNCSLRGAIIAANISLLPNVITLPALSGGASYRLTTAGAFENAALTGDLDIRADITIVGGGATTTIVDGNQADRVFDVINTSLAYLRLQDLTVQSGRATGSQGGGIYTSNPVSLLRVRVRANTAPTGAGLYVTRSGANPAPIVSIVDSTISDNVAGGSGGGIFLNLAGPATIVNSTIAGNRAVAGGGLYQDVSGAVTLKNVTLAGNSASDVGGGVRELSTINTVNTIIANNTAATNPNCDVIGTMASQGFNLVFGGGTCGFTQSSDRQGQNPRLGPLQLNGGTTETMALGAGSAAIDAGSTATPGSGGVSCAAADQRGSPRPAEGDAIGTALCDIGAYELQSPHPADLSVAVAADPEAVDLGGPVTFSATVRNAGPAESLGTSLTITPPSGLTLVSSSPSQGNCQGSGPVTCQLGSIPPSVSASVAVVVTAAAGGSQMVGAQVTGQLPDPEGGNNQASATTRVRVACSPRPNIAIQTARSTSGQIVAVVRPGSGSLTGVLRIGPPGKPVQNATVDVQGGPSGITASQDVPISGTQVTLVVTRRGPGAVTVPLSLTDGCGTWETFVGFGSGV